MLRALDRDPHAGRLSGLLDRFRSEERWMRDALLELQTELERLHREASYGQVDGPGADEALLARCSHLQLEHDELTTELVHVRMAIAGADEELLGYRDRPLPTSERRLGA